MKDILSKQIFQSHHLLIPPDLFLLLKLFHNISAEIYNQNTVFECLIKKEIYLKHNVKSNLTPVPHMFGENIANSLDPDAECRLAFCQFSMVQFHSIVIFLYILPS